VRTAIKRRVRAATGLVVTRGARMNRVLSKGNKKKVVLAFDDADAGAHRWVKNCM